MIRSKRIFDAKKAAANAYQSNELSICATAKLVNRHHFTTSPYLGAEFIYKTKKWEGRKKIIKIISCAIFCPAKHYRRLLRTIKRALYLNLTVRTVQLVLSKSSHVSFMEKKSRTLLKQVHVEEQLNWIRRKLQ